MEVFQLTMYYSIFRKVFSMNLQNLLDHLFYGTSPNDFFWFSKFKNRTWRRNLSIQKKKKKNLDGYINKILEILMKRLFCHKLKGINTELWTVGSSQQRCSIKKGVLKNLINFTEKQLCHSLFFNKVASYSLQLN